MIKVKAGTWQAAMGPYLPTVYVLKQPITHNPLWMIATHDPSQN
jgi:hypothetical protein